MSGETIYRTSVDRPDLRDGLAAALRSWVLGRMRAALADPDALPGEADAFGESKPFGTLAASAAEAERRNARILAFVYDPAQPERSQLDYCLTHFLQNRKTRDAMNGAFVTALVPLSQIASRSPILDGQSMERARWVVFDGSLNAMEQSTLYPNAEEGERIMVELAKRFGRAPA